MGKNASREEFIKSAESLHNLDVGLDHTISFDPKNHQGSDAVYLTVIKNGEYQLITDDIWKSMKKRGVTQ